jgi:hypothetical protein
MRLCFRIGGIALSVKVVQIPIPTELEHILSCQYAVYDTATDEFIGRVSKTSKSEKYIAQCSKEFENLKGAVRWLTFY